MDEAAYRQKFAEVVKHPCVFEKALLSRCVACARAERLQIAERDAVACRNAESLARCSLLHDRLRHAFSFVLGKTHDEVLPHAQEMRVQCGGLMGLQQVLNDSAEVENVDGLLQQAMQQWGEPAGIPYSEVVHAAAQCYRGRHG